MISTIPDVMGGEYFFLIPFLSFPFLFFGVRGLFYLFLGSAFLLSWVRVAGLFLLLFYFVLFFPHRFSTSSFALLLSTCHPLSYHICHIPPLKVLQRNSIISR